MNIPRFTIPAILCAALLAAHSLAAQTLKIQPMGDSITNGTGGTSGFGGYRGTLYTLLTNAGYTVDYVGTVTTNSASLTDMDHEGHGGWQIHQLDANVESWFNSIDDPDVILLHIGTNDFGGGNDITNAINRLDALLTKIATLRPAVHVIVTNLLERAEPRNTEIQTHFNPFVEGVVNSQIAAGHLVSYFDMRSLVPLSDMPDNLHPNQTGYDKMAAGWVTAIDEFVGPGDGVAPAINGAVDAGDAQVLVHFNKDLDQTSAETVGNYSIGGLAVTSSQLLANQRSVLLTTDPLVSGTTYTLTVNNVQDLVSPTPNTIAANSTVQFVTESMRGYFNHVPEAGEYSLVYSLDIPNTANYSSGPVPYDIDYRSRIGSFDRIAYYLERQTATGGLEYAWASMDAFSTNPDEIGVPSVDAGVTWQTGVTNLNVVSNVAGVAVGEGLAGNIEFWPSNYNEVNTAGVPGASGSAFDFGDGNFNGTAGYGSMQVHNTSGTQTVIAFNRWGNSSTNTDVGIGNNPAPVNGGIDWTFAQNGPDLVIKTLQVLVRDLSPPELVSAICNMSGNGITVRFNEPVRSDSLLVGNFAVDNGVDVLGVQAGADGMSVFLQTTCQPAGTALTVTVGGVQDFTSSANAMAPGTSIPVTGIPLEVATNVGATSDGYKLLYTVDIPVVGDFNATTPYIYDDSAASGGFSRIAYYLETQVAGGPVQYVWTSMDAFSSDKSQIGVPTFASGAVFQQAVSNLDVFSNVAGVTNVTGSPDGNIEFWSNNYSKNNADSVPNASNSAYDFGDEITATNPGYGCMQIHNNNAGEVLMALNHWGDDGNTLDVGIGNNAAADTDYTFAANAGSYTRRILHVMILPADPPLPPEVVANVPESAGYELVYSLDIPDVGDFNATNPYSVDESAKTGAFSRIAYYLELQVGAGPVEYVWVSMDPFTGERSKIGIPTAASGAIFQQNVANLNVVSNKTGIVTGTGIATGNIEFWAGSYNTSNSGSVPNASGSLYDWGDNRTNAQGYGSMQIHNHDLDGTGPGIDGQTLFALNRFGNDGSALCLGIGNDPNPGNGTDWTFENNASTYSRKVLHVMVLPAPVPANVLTNVPEASDYELVYTLDIPTNGNLSGGNGFQDYTLNAADSYSKSFSRVAYYMELEKTGDAQPTYAWVSMPAFTADRGKIGVPNVSSGAVFQQLMTDLTVVSNSGALTGGTGLVGNIEFWPTNYSGPNALPVPNAGGAFDFGDTRSATGNYGSMQIHNYAAGETIFAINSWGRTGNTTAALCLGIGNNTGAGDPDYTFANNAPSIDLLRRLHVFTKPGPSPAADLQIVDMVGSTTLDRLVVTFDGEVSGSSADPGNFSIDGGLTVTGATLLDGNREIALTTSAQTPGQLYTVTVNGVREPSGFGSFMAAGTTGQFTAYTPPAILANVPDAGMELVYCLEIPSVRPAWNLNAVTYSVDEAQFGEILFDRVAYLLELDGNWAYASFDPHTNEIAKTGVPTTTVTGPSTSDAFFQTVTNMNVASNVPGVVTGTGITTGNIEFWGENYSATNDFAIPNASGSIHDFGDIPSAGTYGTLQVHNYGASQTILAYNNWGSNTGGASDLGIGNNPSPPAQGATDWTFMNNAGSYTTRNLYVLVRPGGTPSGDPPVIIAHPTSRTVPDGTAVTFAVSVSGTGPFTYQWRCNGIPLAGATSSVLNLGSVSVADVASYDVVVTGPNFVSTTSFAADLNLTGSPPSFLANWRAANGFHPTDGSSSGEGDTEDKDADLRENLLEAAFGTDPNVADAGPLSIDEGAGTFVPGDPVVNLEWNPFSLTIRYVRLVDHATAGLDYTPEYSHGGGFIENPLAPVATRVQIPDGGGGTMDLPTQNINGFDYEVVEEPFYVFDGSGMKADSQLGRVRVDPN